MTFSKVQFVRAVDGDTIIVNIPGVPSLFGSLVPVRLKGIQCPETRTKDKQEKHRGLVAKSYTERWCRKQKSLTLVSPRRGKYFRLIASVRGDSELLNALLLQENLAVKSKS